MKTFNLYIGADNQTKRLNSRKIRSIMAARHQGFTMYPVTGYWNGEAEHSMLVIVADEDATIMETINILKNELEQEAIGYQVVPTLQFA